MRLFFPAGTPITSLHARNISLGTNVSLDVGVLSLPYLEKLAITDGHIKNLIGNIEAKNLACVNLSGNSLEKLGEDTFLSLHSLRIVDLSWNNLTQLASFNAEMPQFKIDLSGKREIQYCKLLVFLTTMYKIQLSVSN
jgi:hypothetical protein